MTPGPAAAPAAIAATTLALRARAVATTATACTPPGDQATSRPTTTDEKWGQIRPSRWANASRRSQPIRLRDERLSCASAIEGNGGSPEGPRFSTALRCAAGDRQPRSRCLQHKVTHTGTR